MAKKKVSETKVLLDIPVKFGKVSLGTKTGSVSFAVQRQFVKLEQADDLFVDRRLAAKVILGRSGDQKKQTLLVPDRDIEVVASFDVKGFRVGSETFSGMNLTFMLREVPLEDVSMLSGGFGRLVISGAQDIPDDAPDDSSQTEAPVVVDGPWADVPLAELFDKDSGVFKALKAGGITTVGDLAQRTAKGDQWARGLKGVGPRAVETISDRMEKFWADNPRFTKP